jgi:peptide/nickel transport system substrate-binding protein
LVSLVIDGCRSSLLSTSNFNEWVGWKWRDRGMQNLANEPLWSVDFATGEIINGLPLAIQSTMTTSPLEIPLREGVTWDDGTPFTRLMWSSRWRR